MPTKMELTLEQSQQSVSYEVSVSIEGVGLRMENGISHGSSDTMHNPPYQLSHSELVDIEKFDESDTHVLERLDTSAGNPVKEILLKLNLPDHRSILTDSKVYLRWSDEVLKNKEFQRSFRHSDTERLSRSDEVLKLKNFKKDTTLKLFKSTNQERSILHDIASNLRMDYLPKRRWSSLDKKMSRIMIKAIDK
ncbi:hypothetical protein Tco_0439863 [Tanacetum coccineum]